MFEKIAGYNDVKEELIRIRSWFIDFYENPTNDNIRLPKGILFYGSPGNGKTLFIEEYSNSFGFPVIFFKGNDDNISMEIHNAFNKSKEFDFSIILIDEIDQLIGGRESVERSLKEELDGITSNKNVLVLATTNSINGLDNSLLRSGRFDRQIRISSPDFDSRKELFSYYVNLLNIKGDFDFDYLSRITHGICCADVTAILNDVLLRCGNWVNTDDIEKSFNRIIQKNINCNFVFDPSKANIEIAYHEVAHALLINKYSSSHYFYKAFFRQDYQGGCTTSMPLDEDECGSEYCYQDIEISLAGYVITQLKLKRLDNGCIDDLQRARSNAVMLVNKLGASGPDIVLPYYCNLERMETEIRRRKNEREIEKIIRKSLRAVKKYLKENMDKIEILVKIMMEKGFIKKNDLDNVMNSSSSFAKSNQKISNLSNI